MADIVNPCLTSFMQTKKYYDICVKHDLVDKCNHNEFFPTEGENIHEYNKATSEHEGDCSNGYCPCPSVENSAAFGPKVSGLAALLFARTMV